MRPLKEFSEVLLGRAPGEYMTARRNPAQKRSVLASRTIDMLDLKQLLRVRSASAGRFDASGGHLAFVADLSGVQQVWAVGDRGWPELLVAPPDRAQTLHPGPLAGQLIVGADVGGNEHTQLLYTDQPGSAWRPLTNNPDRIHSFGAFAPDGN